jgi:hypothetical protein
MSFTLDMEICEYVVTFIECQTSGTMIITLPSSINSNTLSETDEDIKGPDEDSKGPDEDTTQQPDEETQQVPDDETEPEPEED